MFKITVIALGSKMPAWVNEAVSEFSKRLKEFAQVTFIEIPLIKRGKSNTLARIMEKEEILVNAAIPPSAHLIALAIDGKSFGSETLAKKMLDLQQKKRFCLYCSSELRNGANGIIKLNNCSNYSDRMARRSKTEK